MDFQLVQPIFDAIDKGLQGTIATGTANVMTVTGGVFGSFWIITLIMKSIYWLFEGLDAAINDLFISIFKAALIIFFAFNVTWYINTIVPLVSEAPTGITQLLTQSESTAINQIDTLINSFIDTVIAVVGALKFNIFTTELGEVISGVAVFILLILGGFAFLGVCISTLVVLKIATTIFLAIGPVFIAFLLFEQTKQYFWGWVNLLAGFMLTNVLFGVVISLEINYISQNVMGNDGLLRGDWVSILSMPLIFGAFAVIAQVLPNYAASVMSGAPVGNPGGVKDMLNVGGLGAARKIAGGAATLGKKVGASRRNRIQ